MVSTLSIRVDPEIRAAVEMKAEREIISLAEATRYIMKAGIRADKQRRRRD